MRGDDRTEASERRDAEARPGSKNRACMQGIPRNLGGPTFPSQKPGGDPVNNTRLAACVLDAARETKQSTETVPKREGRPKRPE